MRADRLIALLMLLQTHGRMTALELAQRLEVSERTIYRDITALGVAGIPIITESGPGGGCSLVDSYRTNLTGLTEDETRALFMLSLPAPLSKLGVGHELQTALLKLSAALPVTRQPVGEQVHRRIYLDSTWWFQPEEPLPCLPALYQAVWEDRLVYLEYLVRYEPRGEVLLGQSVEPYGLVAKANVWYLVACQAGQMKVYRVSQVVTAHLKTEHFERSSSFDLPVFWKNWCAKFEQRRFHYPVTARVSPELLPELGRYFGNEIQSKINQAERDVGGWAILTLPFERLEDARNRLLGFGGAIEVLAPEALRKSIADFAFQIVKRYKPPD
ncbi:MAG: WYL domain-containing protein [Chloroflexi bacterium]|nr:WYL domain-containing protein [Chloroflexota bacterium]OJW02637.1 MAG: hypothetical protein BGO39_27985 [Chloroflexi bacterium 54-19]